MDVLDHLQRHAPAIFDPTPVSFAYLFGSQATERAHSGSDIDVAVHLEPDLDDRDTLDLRLWLIGAIERALGRGAIDVVVLNDVDLPVIGRVLTRGRAVYCDDEVARVRYESTSRRLFHDFQIHAEPLARRQLAAMVEAGQP